MSWKRGKSVQRGTWGQARPRGSSEWWDLVLRPEMAVYAGSSASGLAPSSKLPFLRTFTGQANAYINLGELQTRTMVPGVVSCPTHKAVSTAGGPDPHLREGWTVVSVPSSFTAVLFSQFWGRGAGFKFFLGQGRVRMQTRYRTDRRKEFECLCLGRACLR